MSNTYIGQGEVDGFHLMKVGKANVVAVREKQIGIRIEFSLACLDEKRAFEAESHLRKIVIQNGGIRHPGTVDWFRFDQRIYEMLKGEMQPNYHKFPQPITEDEEIRFYVQFYYNMIISELQARTESQAEVISYLSQEGNEARKLHTIQNRLIGRLIGMIEYLTGQA